MTKNLEKPQVICLDRTLVERSEADFDDCALFPDQDVFNEDFYSKDQDSLMLYVANLPGKEKQMVFIKALKVFFI